MAESHLQYVMDKINSVTLTDENVQDFSLHEIIKIICKASVEVNCTMFARAKALWLFHKFKRSIDNYHYDPYLVAGACIDLGMKCCEEVVDFDFLIFTLYGMAGKPVENLRERSVKAELQNKENTEECELHVLRKSFLIMEILILRMAEFCLPDKLAHDYITYFLQDLKDKFVSLNIWDVLSETVIKMASDFYLINKCLDYEPDEIAVGVMEFALGVLAVNNKQIETRYKTNWLKCLSDVTNVIKAGIIDELFRLGVVIPVAEEEKMKKERNLPTTSVP